MAESKQRSQSTSGEKGGLFSMISNLSTSFGAPKEVDQWFEIKKTYLNGLENALNALAKANANIVKKRREIVQAYTEFGMASSLIGSAEADHDKWASMAFRNVSEISDQVHSLHTELAENETTQFEESVKDYVRYIQAAKDLLNNRSDLLAAYQNAAKQVDGKKEKFDKAKGTPKAAALEKEWEQAVQKVEETKSAFDTMTQNCKSELERFQQSKLSDFQEMITGLVQMNMNHEVRVLSLWKNFLLQVQDSKQPQQ